MEDKQILVRNANKADITKIAVLHKKLFSDHLLGMMPIFVLKRFYKYFLCSDNIFLCAEIGDEIIGFVLGGLSKFLSKSKTKFLRRNFVCFGFNILIRPKALKMFTKTYLQKNTFPANDNKQIKTPNLRLLSIGVDDSYQGKGIAALIVEKFENSLLERDNLLKLSNKIIMKNDETIVEYGLSVHKNNIKAIRFYHKVGFIDEKETVNSIFLGKKVSYFNKNI